MNQTDPTVSATSFEFNFRLGNVTNLVSPIIANMGKYYVLGMQLTLCILCIYVMKLIGPEDSKPKNLTKWTESKWIQSNTKYL